MSWVKSMFGGGEKVGSYKEEQEIKAKSYLEERLREIGLKV